MEKLGTPVDPKAADKMTDSELIQGIIQQISPSMYCGGRGCGVYCSCNSSKILY
ncbi:hypothetical protein C4K04_4454 [Pseudomonas chlororaphis]|uniref:Uncharacterized protein n=1 Tax=Pseudomonas chlororaphis TaxID=587753 RepID=A0A3G7TSP5_9PSED|nr:hypothetical protein C4K04_4454 [Pseudomonas chlororaphis]